MEYQFFDLLHKELNPSQEEFDAEKYSNILEQENNLEQLISEKDKSLVSDFRISIINYLDDFWMDVCNKMVKRGIMLGMEIQKFIDEIEYY